MVTKEWVAIHRKHHQNTDKEGDPHSPHIYGITQVLLGGAFLYKDAANDEEMIKKYGIGTPDDWLENNIYTPFNWFGIFLMLAINLYLFGLFGLIIWLVQMLWIPFWAAGVINGIGHFLGYRNHDTKDKSRNILPIGLIVGGEELHNNHHNAPASAKLSNKWYEFDIGWFWLRVLHNLKLAKIKDYQ
jgi:stearoyl-CoA desaturase (delta-9 desaturase)